MNKEFNYALFIFRDSSNATFDHSNEPDFGEAFEMDVDENVAPAPITKNDETLMTSSTS